MSVDVAGVATAVAALAERARVTPREPWLFYKEGWDWRWRSWARVADQVMRGLMGLRRALPRLDDDEGGIGFDGRLDPDAVVAGLVAQAAGVVATPVTPGAAGLEEATARGCRAWLEVEGARFIERGASDPQRIVLPPSLPALDDTPRLPLELEADGDSSLLLDDTRSGQALAAHELMVAARGLDGQIPSLEKQVIFCLAPDLAPGLTQRLQAWTLVRGAAWALEPDLEDFVRTVLWARPHV
ncbi:MAG: hypothetical protein AAF560_34185, partial [Acidobacteriota bacterium]